ncbi:hypothetical protein EALG_02329 [Escherichia coli TA144]|nr:hypothetical protein EALG_02329 [Escherichia coli TA144]
MALDASGFAQKQRKVFVKSAIHRRM